MNVEEQDEAAESLRESLLHGEVEEIALKLDRCSDDEKRELLASLGAEAAAHVLEQVEDAQIADTLHALPTELASEILVELPSDAMADVLSEMASPEAEPIIESMPPEYARLARQLTTYDEGTVGAIMRSEHLAYPEDWLVSQVVSDMRVHAEEYSDFETQYAYVVGRGGQLIGVLRIRDLLFAFGDPPLSEIMIKNPISVRVDAPIQEVNTLFSQRHFVGIPVVDAMGGLAGVVLRSAAEEEMAEVAAEDFLKVSGLGGREELRSMPLHLRSGRRLSWLSINIVLNVFAASVIALFQDTLSAVIALAVFLPIISDMSGCSGSQAVAVSIRELTLGLVRPAEIFRVLRKEIAVGLINGAVLGSLVAAVAFLWKGNAWLGLVVGGALALNTIVAVSLGGLIPLLLKRRNLDPALASGPILTTVTDMCGFFFVLGFTTLALQHLV